MKGGGGKVKSGSFESLSKGNEDDKSFSDSKKHQAPRSRKCCCGQHEKCAFIQKIFHHYDPNDPRIGYVKLQKSSGRSISGDKRRYDKIKVVAECLNMSYEEDFDTEKRVALHHYHPKVAEYFHDPATKSRKEKTEILIPKALAYDKLRYPHEYREDYKNFDSDYIPAPSYPLDSVRKDIFRLDTVHMMDVNHARREVNEFLPFPNKMTRESVLTEEEKSLVQDFKSYPQSCAIMVAGYKRRLLEHSTEELKQHMLAPIEEDEVDMESKLTILQGVSRKNLLDPTWHELNPHAAKFLLGFDTLEEFCIYLECYDPNVKFDNKRHLSLSSSSPTRSTLEVIRFEKIMMTVMKFRRNMKDELLGHIWSRSKSAIGRYIKDAAPIVGLWGEELCDLDTTEKFFDEETPQVYYDLDETMIAAQVDGKAYYAESDRSNNLLKRAMYNNKLSTTAFQQVSWTSKMGLAFDHSCPALGAASETAHVQHQGSLHGNFTEHYREDDAEIEREDIEEVEMKEELCDVDQSSEELIDGSDVGVDEETCTVETALIEIYPDEEEGEDVEEMETHDTMLEATSDDEREEEEANQEDEEEEEDSGLVDGIDICEDAVSLMRERIKEIKRLEADPSAKKDSKAAFVIDKEGLKLAARERLIGNVNKSIESKLKQLQHHRRLHMKFRGGSLRKNIMSFYLDSTRKYRNDLINFIQSLQKAIKNGSKHPNKPFIVPSRLGKIPKGWKILADRGFAKDGILYPFLNEILFPHFIDKRQQFEAEEITIDRKICELRYTCEVCFSRVTNISALRGVIPYRLFQYVPHMINWGHANINLGQPLQKPKKWDDHVSQKGLP